MGEPMRFKRGRWLSGMLLALAACAFYKISFSWAELLSGGDIVMNAINLNSGGGGLLSGGEVALTASIGGGSNISMSGGVVEITGGNLGSQSLSRPDLIKSRAFPTLFKPSVGHDRITFRGMTKNAVIRIYTLSGQLVITLRKTDGNSEDYIWFPVSNAAGRPLASGVYLYEIEGDNNAKSRGKFMVVK